MIRTIVVAACAGQGAAVNLDARSNNNNFLSISDKDQADDFDSHTEVSAELRETLHGVAMDAHYQPGGWHGNSP